MRTRGRVDEEVVGRGSVVVVVVVVGWEAIEGVVFMKVVRTGGWLGVVVLWELAEDWDGWESLTVMVREEFCGRC